MFAMKTKYFKLLTSASFLILLLVSACHSGSKDSTAFADSANRQQIAANDSAGKAQIKSSDSAITANKNLQNDASKFLVKSYESGLYEVQLSQLAATNALDPDVKNLALTLVSAHTAINAKIGKIADDARFILPNGLNADHQKDLQDISKLSGADFYKKYVNTIISGHEQSISNYKDAYKDLPDSYTKTFAAETLPKIEDHLSMAQKVSKRIK